MPHSATTTLLALGAVLTTVSPVAGAAVAAGGAVFEGLLLWASGSG